MRHPLKALLLFLLAGTAWCADRTPLVTSATGQPQPVAVGDRIRLPTAGPFYTALAPTATADRVLTLPNATATLAGLSVAQSWSALQTFTDATWKVTGSSDATKTLLVELDGQSAGVDTVLSLGAQTADHTITLPVVAGNDTLVSLATASPFTATVSVTASGALIHRQASTQDGISLLGRAGGTSSYSVTLTPTTLTASRTVTFPDADLVVSGAASALTSGRVPYATTGGLLTDSANLTFNGTNFAHAGSGTFATGTGAVSLNGSVTVATGKTLSVTDLTSGRLALIGASGVLTDSANETYAAGTYTHGDGTGNQVINIAGAAGAQRWIAFKSGASTDRWQIRVTNTAESGSDAGSNWGIYAFTDAGVNIDVPISIVRATNGAITFARPTTQAFNWSQTGSTTISTGTGVATFNCATDATAVGTAGNVMVGGLSVAKRLWVGGTDIRMSSTAPQLWYAETDASANNGKWAWVVNAEVLKLRVLDDAESSAADIFSVARSGATVGTITIGGATTQATNWSQTGATTFSTGTGAISLNGNVTIASTAGIGSTLTTATTNALVTAGNWQLHSSGTPAAGFGQTWQFRADSATVANRVQWEFDTAWVVATDASRTSYTRFYQYDTAARECMRMEASGTAAMLGFFGANSVARPSTSGETTGFTAGGGTTATSSSTFTGNVGATAYTVSDIVKHLKNLGLIAQ